MRSTRCAEPPGSKSWSLPDSCAAGWHIAAMSNLMAALGWALVDLIEHPGELDAVIGATASWPVDYALR